MGAGGAVDVEMLPGEVGAAAEREVDGAGAGGFVGEPVDDDEAAEGAVGGVGLEGERRGEREVDDADVVEMEVLGGEVLVGVDVDAVLDGGDAAGDAARAGLEEVGAAGEERGFAHPDEMGGELVGDRGWGGGGGEDVAAGDVDLLGEDEGDGVAGARLGEVAFGGDDAGERGGFAGGEDGKRVAGADAAGGDGAGVAAEVEMGAVHPLHRHAEGRGGGIGFRSRWLRDSRGGSGLRARACWRRVP